MTTERNAREFDFQGLGSRAVTARFDGGAIASDAGGLLLREVEAKTGILRRFAAGFFGVIGDAQRSVFVVRKSVTHSDGDWHSLYLDGNSYKLAAR